VLAKALSMRTMTFLPRSKTPGSSHEGQSQFDLEQKGGLCRIATTWPLPISLRIRDKPRQGMGNTIPANTGNATTDMEQPDEARD
jgi:hypothetical protein